MLYFSSLFQISSWSSISPAVHLSTCCHPFYKHKEHSNVRKFKYYLVNSIPFWETFCPSLTHSNLQIIVFIVLQCSAVFNCYFCVNTFVYTFSATWRYTNTRKTCVFKSTCVNFICFQIQARFLYYKGHTKNGTTKIAQTT